MSRKLKSTKMKSKIHELHKKSIIGVSKRLTILLAAGLLIGVTTQAQGRFDDRRDINHDRVDIRNDRQDIRHDRYDMSRDRFRGDYRDFNHDRRDLNHDRR